MFRHLLFTSLLAAARAATVTYDFNISWLTRNPDGLFDRPTIGINGQWPIPHITANVGDRIVVHAHNQLGNESTSLHFHGLFQNGTTHMDGPAQVTQCAIPPGSSMTYNFTVNQPGTYWYHSHARGQYPDGLRGPLIIHDPDSPYKGKFDEELVMTVSDWYHDQIPDLVTGFISKANPTGAEPVPKSALMNDTQNLKIPVQPGKTYMFRMINVGAFAGQYIWFEGHNMTIVEVDGVYTQPAEAEMIYLSAAQRCSFMVTTKNDTGTNYAIVASMDTDLFDTLPDDLNYNSTGWLQYDDSKDFPDPAPIDEFDPFDDVTLVPHDNLTTFGEPDQVIQLTVIMDNLNDGANYAFFDNISYKAPTVPTLYTVLTSGELATNPQVYGTYTHSFVLERGQVVEIQVNNNDAGKHPFHLHGHNFQALYRSDDDAGNLGDSNVTEADYPPIPMRRDTLVVHPNGFMVLRFKADNPGIWLFHCHIEWHLLSGLMATMIEAPLDLQRTLQIPQDHKDACAAANVPTAGNAAGNTVNLLDLTGEPAPPGPLPDGFTTKGKVAMAFSVLSGLLGVIVISWYGFAKVTDESYAEAQRRIAESQGTAAAAGSSGDEAVKATAAPQTEEITAASDGGLRGT